VANTDPNMVKKQVKKVTIYHDVFKHNNSGKKVLEDMIRVHHVINSSFSDDPCKTAFKEGERNVVLRILSILEMNPNEFLKLVEEANRDA